MPYVPNTNPYSLYGATMPTNYYGQASAPYPQQTLYAAAQPQTQGGIIWVDGEVGAKAYQMPTGVAPNTPIALWDTNDTVIYLKSINQMGMPNPLQKIHYKMEEHQQEALPAGGQSGNSQDMSQYVTKADFEQMKKELKEYLSSENTSKNQNGSNLNGNRGGR